MVRGSTEIILVSHVATVARQANTDTPPGLQERSVCTLLLTKSVLGFPDWIRCGCRGVGDIRPACLLPLVKSKCFLDFWVRRRRVMDCSSIPHKMAWRSVARAIRTVARLGGPGCENFDISQLRFELDSMLRCCWRCGCAMSCVGLVTADIDQAFGARSSSAVSIVETHLSDLRIQVTVKLCLGSSWVVQTWEFSIVWSWVAVVYDSGLGPGVVQFHVGFPGHVGLHCMANSGHSNCCWGHELCRSRRRGAWVVWTASRASPVRVSFPGGSSSQLHLMY